VLWSGAGKGGKGGFVSHPSPVWLDEAEPASLPPEIASGTVVVTGNFDGVHRGHQALFARAHDEARARGLTAVALTFDPHPRSVLGGTPPALLTSTERRVELVVSLGVRHIFIRRFDRAFAAWQPEVFVEKLLVGTLGARVVVAGDNFRFGAKRSGDDALLRALGPKLGFEAFTLEANDEKGPLSSSRVRDALSQGDVIEASRVLGRPHSIEGVVVRGDQRGRTIGFPTANLGAVTELVPPHGVYAVLVDQVDRALGHESAVERLGAGVMNIGVRPTVGGDLQRTLEVHLLDWSGDLYGKTLRVHFVARLREERKFDGLPALKAQIARDAEAARQATAGATADP
jgi:riboflavin kinase/FMN adenylyltransferase